MLSGVKDERGMASRLSSQRGLLADIDPLQHADAMCIPGDRVPVVREAADLASYTLGRKK